MAGLELPGGLRVEVPDPTAAQIVQALAPILMGISSQLTILIEMESGLTSRAEMRRRFQEQLAKANAQANGKAP